MVQESAAYFRARGATIETIEAVQEHMKFAMPNELNSLGMKK